MLFSHTPRTYLLLLLGASSTLLSACQNDAVKGDAARGEELYAQCADCHKLQVNSVGPMHCGLIGRAAGSVPDFNYSEAMKSSELVWDAKTLDEFLTSPISYVVGTNMGFVGLANPADRADVVAYLQRVASDPAICPPR